MKVRHFKRRQTTQRRIWTFMFGKKEYTVTVFELCVRKHPHHILGVARVH